MVLYDYPNKIVPSIVNNNSWDHENEAANTEPRAERGVRVPSKWLFIKHGIKQEPHWLKRGL